MRVDAFHILYHLLTFQTSFFRENSYIKLIIVELRFLKDGRLLILLLETTATSHSSYC